MGIPLVALMGKTPQELGELPPVELQEKLQAIKSSQQQQQQSAQAFPVEQQQRQEQLTAAQLANQQTRIQMQDKQGIAQALRDSYGGPQAGSVSTQIAPSLGGASQPSSATPASGPTAAPNAPATPPTQPSAPASQPTNPTDRLAALTSRIQDPKYGISPQGQIALIEQLTGLGQKVQTLDKDTIGNIEDAHKIVSQGYNSVLEAAPEDQPAQWTLERNQMLRSSSPTVQKVAQGLPAQYPGQPAPGGSPEAQAALHSLMAEQDIVAAAKLPGEKAKAGQEVQAASKPTPQQISDASSTVGTYAAIPPNMRQGLLTELRKAPDYATLQKVQQRADAANESFQRSADARQQASAMKDVALGQVVAGQLVKQDEALATNLNSTSGIRSLLNMTTGGNQMASAAALTRFAEHEVKEGGINRFNETELNAMGKAAGSWSRQFQAWVDKGASGTPPPATNADIQSILNVEDKQAHDLHDQNVGFIQQRYAPIAGGKAAAIVKPSSTKQQSGAGHPFFEQFGGQAGAPPQ